MYIKADEINKTMLATQYGASGSDSFVVHCYNSLLACLLWRPFSSQLWWVFLLLIVGASCGCRSARWPSRWVCGMWLRIWVASRGWWRGCVLLLRALFAFTWACEKRSTRLRCHPRETTQIRRGRMPCICRGGCLVDQCPCWHQRLAIEMFIATEGRAAVRADISPFYLWRTLKTMSCIYNSVLISHLSKVEKKSFFSIIVSRNLERMCFAV